QRFALFKNAPGIFVPPVRPGLRRNGAADFFKPEQNHRLSVPYLKRRVRCAYPPYDIGPHV
ncbi:hypothetical protein, partial [Cronobacter muytjensii]|uniref:hypothetical protein n=1 Tax=Cronobacter muytjensii TaxID=413501 RepID=UPI001F290F1A